MRGEESLAARAALCPQPSPSFGLAGLLVEFADSHFLFDPAPLDQFAEAADGLLSRLAIT
jgi:hypothetical protein